MFGFCVLVEACWFCKYLNVHANMPFPSQSSREAQNREVKQSMQFKSSPLVGFGRKLHGRCMLLRRVRWRFQQRRGSLGLLIRREMMPHGFQHARGHQMVLRCVAEKYQGGTSTKTHCRSNKRAMHTYSAAKTPKEPYIHYFQTCKKSLARAKQGFPSPGGSSFTTVAVPVNVLPLLACLNA
jgi:hypothetical protein